MTRASTARWASRVIALAMIVACVLVLRVFSSQLRRLTEREARSTPPPSTETAPAAQPEKAPVDGPREPRPEDAALAESLPVMGEIPEGANW